MPQFSHLHVHTQYSLLDGAASISSLYRKAAQEKMPALAITDHGNMFGVFSFVNEAWKRTKVIGKTAEGKEILEPEVKPVVGCEFYVVENRFRQSFTKADRDERFHQVLLAKDETGYRNLTKLCSLGYIEGSYGKYPRIDKNLIEQYHEGLIATTCCIGGYVPQAILNKAEETAEAEFKWWYNLFGDDYFIELQRHGMKEENQVNTTLLKWSKKYNVPVIATNDSHYTDLTDYNAHDILLCINTNEKQSTPGFDDFVNDDAYVKDRRFKFPNDQFYFKSVFEMEALFKDIPEAIDNTNIITDRVKPLNLMKDILLPAFPVPGAFQKHTDTRQNQWEYLKHLTFEGARKRYAEITAEVADRLEFELKVIREMGFAGYFLIVSDFIREGRDMGVFIGPGRGSAAGSAVAYCIGITNIDPIKYDLLFERFLNPSRKSMPDIDTDFDDAGRQDVIDYVVKKYGKEQVAQIVTYGTMAAKMSIKDVARAMDLPLPESNALAKMVPEKPGTKLYRVLTAPFKTGNDGVPGLEDKEQYNPDELAGIKKLRDVFADKNTLQSQVLTEALKLEGSVRSTGVHAAGIIIAPQNLTELMPIATSKDSPFWITQIDGENIENAGVIKMDFLGLKTLSIMKTALRLIKEGKGVEINLDEIPLDDEKTFELFQQGATNGTFQFESAGMQKYLRDLAPDQLSDLIAMNALFRPGPMQYIPDYIKRKKGIQEITYDLPEMAEFLEETYGITVYQEQVMRLSQKLGDFTGAEADDLRKAMGKKKRDVLDKLKSMFMERALKKGFAAEVLDKIWSDWEYFGNYAFNKSHSTCYAIVAYQTGYLKANYPVEYMAAVLNHQSNIEKITFFLEECKRMNIPTLGPGINESVEGFAVNKKGEIRFGLSGLKGVGQAAIESIVEEREKNGPYEDIFDFVKRIDHRAVNRKTMEGLVYSGAFDDMGKYHRAQYFASSKKTQMNGLDMIMKYGKDIQQSSNGMANTLFAFADDDLLKPPPELPYCEPWSLNVKLGHEKEITGVYLSGHPLDNYLFEMKHFDFTPIAEFNEFKEYIDFKEHKGRSFLLTGLITSARKRETNTGKKFAILEIEDYSGKTEIPFWSQDYAKYVHLLQEGFAVAVSGYFKERMRHNENGELVPVGWEFTILKMDLMENMRSQHITRMHLQIYPHHLTQDFVNMWATTLKGNSGPSKINFVFVDQARKYSLDLGTSKSYTINGEISAYLMKNPHYHARIEHDML